MYQSDLLSVFRIMSENPDSWDSGTLTMAAGYERWPSKASTCFFVMGYEDIFSETDALFRVLQNKWMDIGFCCARIRVSTGVVERQRQEFGSVFEQKCAALSLTVSVRSQQSVRDERKQMFYYILDNVSVQLKARFGELAFLGLVDCTKSHNVLMTPNCRACQNMPDSLTRSAFSLAKSDCIAHKQWGMNVNPLDSFSACWPRRIRRKLFPKRQSYSSWCSLYRLQRPQWKGHSLLWKDSKHTVRIGPTKVDFHPWQ